MNIFLLTFVPLFVAFDIIGLLPIYVKYTENLDKRKRLQQLRDSLVTASIATVVFVLAGNQLLLCLGATIKDFLVAGGFILFIGALKDLVGSSSVEDNSELFGIVPLGIPLLAGPAVWATSVISCNQYGYFYCFLSLGLNLLLCGLVLGFSGFLMKLLGKRLSTALSKISCFMVASIAVMFIRKGLGL